EDQRRFSFLVSDEFCASWREFLPSLLALPCGMILFIFAARFGDIEDGADARAVACLADGFDGGAMDLTVDLAGCFTASACALATCLTIAGLAGDVCGTGV